MNGAPRGLRLHVGLFGRRNVGKSSLLNALTRQEVAIVSATPGTTTDPVEKPMELLPLGPVLFIDTAGVDDEGASRLLAAAARTGLGLRETAVAEGLLSAEEFDALTSPEAVCRLGAPVAAPRREVPK